MNDAHEVISAFLDDEPFDAGALDEALSDPAGRALLIDLVALRHVMQPGSEAMAAAGSGRSSRLRTLLAIAAVLVGMVGGFWLGARRGTEALSTAPAATRVVETGEWRPLP
jgi:hypothetical protein